MKYPKIPDIENFKGNSIMAASSGVSGIIEAWSNYKQTIEVETTKREAIWAQRDIAIERIKAQKEFLSQYLSCTFTERAYNFRAMFDMLDKGIEQNNDTAIDKALGLIINQIQQSPLAALKDLKAVINDPNIKSIEI